jgi:hypothetical protein
MRPSMSFAFFIASNTTNTGIERVTLAYEVAALEPLVVVAAFAILVSHSGETPIGAAPSIAIQNPEGSHTPFSLSQVIDARFWKVGPMEKGVRKRIGCGDRMTGVFFRRIGILDDSPTCLLGLGLRGPPKTW